MFNQWNNSTKPITQFTNETAGTIKGSTTPGQVQAETDGTGSLVGYDTLVSNIAQNTTAIGTANSRIDAVETKNTDQDTAITRAQTVANNSYGGFGVSKTPQDVKLNLTKNNGDIDTFPILPVDTQNSGIVTPTMFNQWNNSTKPIINQLDIGGTDTTTTIYTYNGGTIDLIIDTSGGIRIATTGGITLTGQATYTYSSQLQMKAWLKTNNLSLYGTNTDYNMDFILYQNNEFKAILKIYLMGRISTAVVVSYEY